MARAIRGIVRWSKTQKLHQLKILLEKTALRDFGVEDKEKQKQLVFAQWTLKS